MAAHTDNAIVINAPLEKVWEITNDVEKWPDLFTEYAEATILEREGNRILFRLSMHPDENGTVWSWTSERTMFPDQQMTKSHRVETGPFEYMKIEWYYEPAEGGTKMRWVQDFQMKPTAPVNDQQMEERINTNTKVQMNVIKEKIEARVGAAS